MDQQADDFIKNKKSLKERVNNVELPTVKEFDKILKDMYKTSYSGKPNKYVHSKKEIQIIENQLGVKMSPDHERRLDVIMKVLERCFPKSTWHSVSERVDLENTKKEFKESIQQLILEGDI